MSSVDENTDEFEWATPEERELFSAFTLDELEMLTELGVTLVEQHIPVPVDHTPETETMYTFSKEGDVTHVTIFEKGEVVAGLEAESENVVELEAMR
jgi:hypothetical protein